MYVWAAVAVAVGVATFLAGRGIAPDETAQRSAYDLSGPAYAAAEASAGRSRGGFTGFAEVHGPEGRTVLAGVVRAVAGGEVRLETEAGPARINLTDERSLRRIETIDAGLIRPGASVLVVLSPDGEEVTGLLLLPPP